MVVSFTTSLWVLLEIVKQILPFGAAWSGRCWNDRFASKNVFAIFP